MSNPDCSLPIPFSIIEEGSWTGEGAVSAGKKCWPHKPADLRLIPRAHLKGWMWYHTSLNLTLLKENERQRQKNSPETHGYASLEFARQWQKQESQL